MLNMITDWLIERRGCYTPKEFNQAVTKAAADQLQDIRLELDHAHAVAMYDLETFHLQEMISLAEDCKGKAFEFQLKNQKARQGWSHIHLHVMRLDGKLTALKQRLLSRTIPEKFHDTKGS